MHRTSHFIFVVGRRRVLCVLLIAWIAAVAIAEESKFTSLTSETQSAEIVSIDNKGLVKLTNGQVQLDQLREIETSATQKENAPAKPYIIHLRGDGILFAKSISIADESCKLMDHGLGDDPLQIPIDLVQSVQLQPKQLPKNIIDSFQNERDEDQLVLHVDGAIESVNGLIEKLDDEEVTFYWNEKPRTFPRKSLLGIGVASSGESRTHNCLIQLANGSSFAGKIESLQKGKLKIVIADHLPVIVNWSDVFKIHIRSDRLQFLTDIVPTAFQHQPIVTSKRMWQKDRNVSGDELKLGKQTYSKGIGVASHSRLEYQLKGEYATFCATVGIDAETGGRGHCIFVVRGDGKELVRETMHATDDPRKLKIDINGIQQMELIVEYGADLDLADHANWCDACLLRK